MQCLPLPHCTETAFSQSAERHSSPRYRAGVQVAFIWPQHSPRRAGTALKPIPGPSAPIPADVARHPSGRYCPPPRPGQAEPIIARPSCHIIMSGRILALWGSHEPLWDRPACSPRRGRVTSISLIRACACGESQDLAVHHSRQVDIGHVLAPVGDKPRRARRHLRLDRQRCCRISLRCTAE
jgi:hypothetical protein